MRPERLLAHHKDNGNESCGSCDNNRVPIQEVVLAGWEGSGCDDQNGMIGLGLNSVLVEFCCPTSTPPFRVFRVEDYPSYPHSIDGDGLNHVSASGPLGNTLERISCKFGHRLK